MFCLKEHYKGVIPQCWIDKLNSNSNLKRERSGSPPDRRRWCREPPAAVCGAGTAAAAARAPVDGLKTVRKGAPLCNHFLNHPSFTSFHVQCPQQHTLILYILYSSDDDIGNTLSYFKGICRDPFAAYIAVSAAKMPPLSSRCHTKLLIVGQQVTGQTKC